MKIAFISNYINHHQIPFSNACYELLGEDYHFIQTQPMEKERLSMGWSSEGVELPYVSCLYEEEEKCRRLVQECDVLLAGWSNREELIQERLKAGGLTIRISERLYREGQWKAVSPRGLFHKYKEHTRFRNKAVYLLCAGAYVPSDFHLIRSYPGKMFKWGYFPETRYYAREELLQKKGRGSRVEICWAGRFIPLKHPEYMLRLAKALRESREGEPGPDFHIHMAGGGQMEGELKNLAGEYGVEDAVTFYGFMSPEKVRSVMEKSHIFVFTSSHLEGWGAVVNEAMNSGCAVVANVQAGAVPYLIEQGVNGIAYPRGSYEKMEEAVRFLLQHPKERESMGLCAYETISRFWNAEHGAKELLRMAEGLREGRIEPAQKGPFSPAEVIPPGKMFEWMEKNCRLQGKP